MADFNAAIQYVLRNESGEYTERADDHGGPTKWGITLALLRDLRGAQIGPQDVAALTQEQASQIYFDVFWAALRLQQVDSQGVATAILDGAANFGARRSLVFAQRACGATDDGIPGPDTITRLNTMPERHTLPLIMARWQDYYVELVESERSQIVFLKGWLGRARRLITLLP